MQKVISKFFYHSRIVAVEERVTNTLETVSGMPSEQSLREKLSCLSNARHSLRMTALKMEDDSKVAVLLQEGRKALIAAQMEERKALEESNNLFNI